MLFRAGNSELHASSDNVSMQQEKPARGAGFLFSVKPVNLNNSDYFIATAALDGPVSEINRYESLTRS